MNIKLLLMSVATLGTVSLHATGISDCSPGELRPVQPLNSADAGVSINSNVTREFAVGAEARPAKARHKIAEADPTLFEGRTVYGALVSSNAWSGVSITEVPYGVYSFEIGDNPSPQVHISDMSYGFKAAAWGRDRLYGIVPLNVMGFINGSRNIMIDTKNWKETSNVMHDTGEGTYSLMACSIAYDITNDTFYAFRYKEDLSGLDWVKVNTETSQFEPVAAYRGKTVVLTLAGTPDGTMYYIDQLGDLYTINKDSGRTSLVGATGVTPTAYDQCMVYDNRSGSFIWAALSDEGSVLYSVDPTTAVTKRVMKFKNSEQFVALFITDSDALPGAPAAVGRPQLKYSANGALEGNVTFTVPSKTFGGSALSGNVNLNVFLDGENLKGEDVAAGTPMTIPVTLEEGNHYVCITVDNETGFSPMRYIYQYAGYDTPVTPGNAKMEFKDNQNLVSWDVPEGGVNKGYVDFDNLTYDVVRMPDNVKVAKGLKATSFSEPTPEALQAYYYQITACNNNHFSIPAETNRVLCGDAFPVPYSQNFEEQATFDDFFKVVDNDGSGTTWRYGYGGEVRMDYIKNNDTPFDADDWLILPKVFLQYGVKYRFHMNMKTFTPAYPEDFEILIGTDTDDIASFKSLKKEVEFTDIANEFGDYTLDFLPEASGDYNVAVRYCSRHDENSSLMMIKNVGIDKVGNAGAPAQVADMTITPDANDELKAAISFKSPQLNLIGEQLSAISDIKVYRNDDTAPVHVFETVTPGQELSWTDENVPNVGIHTYTVIASNEAGEGEFRTEEQFIGIYTAPYRTDFADKKYSQTLWSSEDNIEDNDNGWNGWLWTEDANKARYFSLFYYLTEAKDTEIWLFSPKFKFEDNTVYTVGYKGYFPGENVYPDMEWQIAYGEDASGDEMTAIEGIDQNGVLSNDFETVLVNRAGGRYNIGFGVTGGAKSDMFSAKLENFTFTRRASAFAPCRMTDYKIEADQTGELKAAIEFKTPTTNYYDEKLDADENLTVKIYQGKDATIPSYTTTAKPGEKVQWVDEKAIHGFNYYRITCENSFGPGEVLRDTLYVGRDKPAVIENLAFRGVADNANVRLTWDKPAIGENGGLVLDTETKYNVYSYNPETNELTPIAENVAEKTYLVEQNCNDEQLMYYYAVTAVNTEGEGQALASGIVLGKPYDLPFEESFANAALSTQLWQSIPMVQGATSAGVDNPEGGSYNGCQGPQDNDGGCVYFYNGSQYEAMIGALLVSPKVRVTEAGGNELSFWAYHYAEHSDYQGRGTLYVAVSADDAESVIIETIEVGGEKETGWTEHKVNLDQFKNADYLSFILMGVTPGYQDVIYVDNVRLSSSNAGVDGVVSDGMEGRNIQMFDINGLRLNSLNGTQGNAVIIRDGKKVLNRTR